MTPIPYTRLLRRAPLVAVGAVVAHLLPWMGLRTVITTACVVLCQALGLDAVRVSPTTFTLPGWPMSMDVACTMIDLYLAAVPLLWCTGQAVGANLQRLALFFVGLMAFNIARLVAGFWLFAHGVSWFLAHEVFAGVVMFVVLEWICRQPAMQSDSLSSSQGPA